MNIKAFKMDGLGNDFVIIDNREKVTNLTKDQIIKICDRNFIGCDQLILINKDQKYDASIVIFLTLMAVFLVHVEMVQGVWLSYWEKKKIKTLLH